MGFAVDSENSQLDANDIAKIRTAIGGGGSSLTLTDGTHTIADASHVTVSGAVVGGTSPNATLAVSAGRTVLTADTTFYVATTGSDTTGDGTVGKPWQHLQYAIDYAQTGVTTKNVNVFIQAADGTYDENLNLGPTDGVISGHDINTDTLQGNLADKSKVVVGPATVPGSVGGAIQIANSAWSVLSLAIKTQGSGNEPFIVVNRSYAFISDILFVDNINAGAGLAVFDVEDNSVIEAHNLTFNGTLASLAFASQGSTIVLEGTIDYTIDPGLSEGYLAAIWGAKVIVNATYSGSAAAAAAISTRIQIGSVVVDDPPFLAPAKYAPDHTSSYNGMMGAQSKAGLPIATDLSPSTSAVFKDTSGGGVYLAYNDAGTVKKVALT